MKEMLERQIVVSKKKKQCWEYKSCGREPGGKNAHELGVCPAALVDNHNGKNGGIKSGRYCWIVAGTLCNGEVQGSFAKKILTCGECDFYRHVCEEEGEDFEM